MNRIGIGYDQHTFAADRRFILGGIEIPFDKGLLGHSDGDALLHSLCNALLGAMAKGDIGEWFPDTDPQYKDIDSSKLVSCIAETMKGEGYRLVNMDAMIITESPKITPFKEKIKTRIAQLLETTPERINIKATRPEGMGILEGGKGLAAYVIVMLEKTD
jgi:2-C-methyl-D-erythritol 2,4-cyclodiphosphate synthase